MKNFFALPCALLIHFLVLKASYEMLIQVFDEPQDWQMLIVALMGIFSAGAVKVLIEVRFDTPIFGKMALLLLGIIFGVSAVFLYMKNFGTMENGFEGHISFGILSLTALIFGTRN